MTDRSKRNGKAHLVKETVAERAPFKRANKLALVGFCANTRHLAPWDDLSFEIWGLNKGYIWMPVEVRGCDRWFETHGPNIYNWEIRRPGKHLDWMKAFKGPIYLHERDDAFPTSVAYPLIEVSADVMVNCWRIPMTGPGSPAVVDEKGRIVLQHMTERPYLTSTIAYQLALAIYERFEEIHLFGIDLTTDGEYAWQKDGVEFLLGVAAARGIKIVIPDDAALLRGKLYGRGFKKAGGERITLTQYETRLKSLQTQIQQLAAQWHQSIGARQCCEALMTEMPPGLNAEKMSDHFKQLRQNEAQLEASVRQTEGKLVEIQYWISMTPEGQDGGEAIAQLKAAKATVALPEHTVCRTTATGTAPEIEKWDGVAPELAAVV